jgi:3-oxoacyl-[acyl-carrier-protein] synthase-3
VRTIFGDAAAATLVTGVNATSSKIGPFVYGTDGRGAKNLIVPAGGMRCHVDASEVETTDESGNSRTINNLFMNGSEIFAFTLRSVPKLVNELLKVAALPAEMIDYFVFHQANEFMLEALRKKIQIPPEKFPVEMANCGNTVSSTIPIMLKRLSEEGRLAPGQRCMLVGFGVGYSWAGTVLEVGVCPI